mgnify:CR=1 FL=1
MSEITYIYAFPGMGKTTLCQQFGYTDLDIHHPQVDPITHPIVLTNDPTLPCVGYFLPKDFEKAFAFKPYNRIANKNAYLVIEEETDLEAIVKQIVGEDNFCNLPNLRQFHNGQLCRYLKILDFSSYSNNTFTHLKSYIRHNFEETEDVVKHYEVFDTNIVIVPDEFYDLVKEKIMPAA